MSTKVLGHIDLLGEFLDGHEKSVLQSRFAAFEDLPDGEVALKNEIVDEIACECDLELQIVLKRYLTVPSSMHIQGAAVWPEYRKGWYRIMVELVGEEPDFDAASELLSTEVASDLERRMSQTTLSFLNRRLGEKSFAHVACAIILRNEYC